MSLSDIFDYDEYCVIAKLLNEPTLLIDYEKIIKPNFIENFLLKKIYLWLLKARPVKSCYVDLAELAKITTSPIVDLIELLDTGKNISNIGHYIAKLSLKHQKLALKQLSLDNYDNLATLKVDVDKILDFSLEDIKIIDLREATEKALLSITNEKPFKNDLDILNTVTSFMGGKLIVIAGRPGGGKTSFALNLSSSYIKQDAKVLFFSLEMNEKEIAKKMVDMEFYNQTIDDFASNAGKFMGLKFLDNFKLVNHFAVTPQAIETLAKQQNPDFIFIDQLDCLPVDGRLERHDLRVGANVIALKDLANKLGIPIFLLHQMNRKADDSNSNKLNFLKDSAIIEQKADIVIFLSPDDESETEAFADTIKIKLSISKNRMGKTGRKLINFDRKRGLFYDS